MACKDAERANMLTYALVLLFCCGPIQGVCLYKSSYLGSMYTLDSEDPELQARGQIVAHVLLGIPQKSTIGQRQRTWLTVDFWGHEVGCTASLWFSLCK